jgi:hypothetical protein
MTPRLAALKPAIAFLACLACLPAPAAAEASRAEPAGDEEGELFLMLFGEAPPVESPDEMLLVAEISVEGPPSVDEEYVRSFAERLGVGDRMSARELDGLLEKAAGRMSLSNMFYRSSASRERLEGEGESEGPVAVRVVLRVDEGFWWGFNFHPWDLSVAYRNLGGKGEQLAATLGLNTQELSYRDPSISYGPLYWALEAGHLVRLDSDEVDPACLYENASLCAELGLNLSDDLSLGLAFGCGAFRSPSGYFLYPGYEAPSGASLDRLGLSAGFSRLLSAGLRVGLGTCSYRKRGGLRGEAIVSLDALSSSLGDGTPVARASALALLRLDAPRLLRLTLRERITYLSDIAGSGIPEALWAGVGELRCKGGLVSGELASLSRLSLDIDRVAAAGIGFAEIGIVPELFYELASVSRESYGPDPRFQQDIGFLLKGVVSTPVGRTFALGFAIGLEGESSSRFSFVFEVS